MNLPRHPDEIPSMARSVGLLGLGCDGRRSRTAPASGSGCRSSTRETVPAIGHPGRIQKRGRERYERDANSAPIAICALGARSVVLTNQTRTERAIVVGTAVL